MMIIRQIQMEALSRSSQEFSAEKMAVYLTNDFPEQAEALGPKGVLAAAQYGIQKAAGYGFQNQEEVTVYLYTMFTFGQDFDENPAFPWAADILNRPATDSCRAGKLLDLAGDHEHLGQGLDESKTN